MAKHKLERYTVDINDQDLLQQWYQSCYPGGFYAPAGPAAMTQKRVLCAIIESIAAEKGWKLEKPHWDNVSDPMMFRMIKGDDNE